MLKAGIKLLNACHISAAKIDRSQLIFPTSIDITRKVKPSEKPAFPKVAQIEFLAALIFSGFSTMNFCRRSPPNIKKKDKEYKTARVFQLLLRLINTSVGPVSSAEFLFLRKWSNIVPHTIPRQYTPTQYHGYIYTLL